MSPEPQETRLTRQMRKHRVYQEEAKTRQTSHWDWDYLPMSTLVRLARDKSPVPGDSPPSASRGGRLRIAVTCIAAGILLMAAILAFIWNDLPLT